MEDHHQPSETPTHASTTFKDVLHGFQMGRGMGTASLEAKMLQQLTDMREAVLFKVFLYLYKAYYALDWDRCLEIIASHRFGPRTIRQGWP